MIKKFKCGLCDDGIHRTREHLKIHLKQHIRNQFINLRLMDGKYIKQNQWIVEFFQEELIKKIEETRKQSIESIGEKAEK